MGVIWTSRTRAWRPQSYRGPNPYWKSRLRALYNFTADQWQIDQSRRIYGATQVGSGVAVGPESIQTSGNTSDVLTLAHSITSFAQPLTFVIGSRWLSASGVAWSLLDETSGTWTGFYGGEVSGTNTLASTLSNSFDGVLSVAVPTTGTPNWVASYRGVNDGYAVGPGRLITTEGAVTPPTSIPNNTGVTLGCSALGGGRSNPQISVFSHFAILQGYVSLGEMSDLAANPWQLFAPERRPVFYSLPAAGGTSSAVVWNSRTRTRQPRRFARADTGRLPITHLWSGSAGAGTFIPDAAGTAHGTKGTLVAGQGYSIKPTGDSVVIEFDTSVGGANSQIINLGDASGSGGPRRLTAFTLFMEFMVPSIAQAVFYSSGAGGLQFSLESGGILNLVKSNIAVIGVASTAVATTNVWHKAAVSYDGTNYQFVLNGAAAGSGSNAVTISPVQQYFGGLVVGSDSYGAPPNGSKLKTLAILNKVCSVEEMSRLCANPWQLFAPERRPKFFSVGSGANTYAVGISETATASETVSMLAAFGASISETATASETVATTAVLNASISETATASETVSMVASFVVTIGETATASETVAMALGAATFAVDISETATASETVSMLAAFGTSISETATASDLVSMLATFLVGISETATASETVAMQLANQTYAVDISETATASDTVVMTIPTTYAISIIETVQAGDYVSMGVPSSDFWTQVTTTQSAGWGQINNTQSSGWTIIPTT